MSFRTEQCEIDWQKREAEYRKRMSERSYKEIKSDNYDDLMRICKVKSRHNPKYEDVLDKLEQRKCREVNR
jgi:hypothetical protein